MKDYYKILGLDPDAEDFLIPYVRKKLLQHYHPDRFKGDVVEINKRIANINEAFKVLNDPAQRKAYDESQGIKSTSDADIEVDAVDLVAKSADWIQAEKHYPDLVAINEHLSKISHQLAYNFRAKLLDSNDFDTRKQLADRMERELMESYFGSDPLVVNFAFQLIDAGKIDAAKALIKLINNQGNVLSPNEAINKICKEFNFESTQMREARLQRERQAQPIKNIIRKSKRAKEAFKNAMQRIQIFIFDMLLIVGVLVFPYLFVWLLLRKRHSKTARIIGFAYLVVFMMVNHKTVRHMF